MRFDPKSRIEDEDIILMLGRIADQMFMTGRKKMQVKKLGITAYAHLNEGEFRLKYSIDWLEVHACVEIFVMAKVRSFYCKNMGIEIILDTDMDDPMKLYCDRREILRDGDTPEFEGVFDDERKEWIFQRRAWT